MSLGLGGQFVVRRLALDYIGSLESAGNFAHYYTRFGRQRKRTSYLS